ncbi:MAG: hypothetical protein AAGI37_15640 [Planctomycetota bacterium]
MGYTDFDIALLNAWDREHAACKDDPARLKQILQRRQMSTYTRPLRSWSLVLRANDARIDDNSWFGNVRMDGARIRQLCSPVEIPYPGVSLDEAARLFGVNRTTVSRWANPEDSELTWWRDVQWQVESMSDMRWPPSRYQVIGKRLMLEHCHNVANPKRSTTRVWTPGYHGIDPGGGVWSADWGTLRVGLADKVPLGFEQQLQRVDRKLGRQATGRPASPATPPRSRVWQWVCSGADGGCGRLVYKLYLPMPFWTLVDAYAGRYNDPPMVDPQPGVPSAFLCLKCAGLLYESAERRASPGKKKDGTRRRVNTADRFVKRISGGVVTARAAGTS